MYGLKMFFFSSCQCVYRCVRDDWQLCLVLVNSLITHLQLKKMSVIYQSAHVAITFQLLEMSSITTPNQTISNIRTRYKFFKGNISDFTNLNNENNQIWKFCVNGIVSVIGTRVNVYQRTSDSLTEGLPIKMTREKFQRKYFFNEKDSRFNPRLIHKSRFLIRQVPIEKYGLKTQFLLFNI